MQTVTIKGKAFSKVVLGTNAIYGRSHFSEARDLEYSHRNTDAYVLKLIEKCIEYGVNAVETSANERITKLVSKIRENGHHPFYLIGNTRIDQTSQMKSHQEKFDYLIDQKSDICIVHSQFVDRPGTEEKINGLERLLDKIHEAGLIAGISTHKISTISLCERLGYDIDVYLFPLNMTGFVYPEYTGNETVADRIKLVQNTQKPFLLMKTLGAGRIPPDEGLRFVVENSKSNDIITLGLSSLEEAEESLGIIQDHFTSRIGIKS